MKYTWLVEKYLEGELSGEALRKFELEILRKPEVAEEVERVRAMHHFMVKQHGKLQDSIGLIEDYEDIENVIDEEIIRQDLEGLKVRKISNGQKDVINLRTKLTESKVTRTLVDQRSNKVLVRKVSVWLAAASVAFLMVTSISLMVGKKGTVDYMAVYEQHYAVPYADVDVRDLSTETNSPYSIALDEYNNGNFENAYALFNEIPEESPPGIKYYLYKGNTAMKLGDFPAAIRSFTYLKSDAMMKHDGMWYTGLSYLGMENIPEVRAALEEIIATDRHYYKKQAKKLLRSL
jgi:ethanolamine utilization protein EutQ (cupin superfamily)